MKEFMKPGVTLQYTNTNKKGKTESIHTHKVVSLENHKDTLVMQIELQVADEKGKEQYSNNFPIKCHQGTLYMDMQNLVPNTGAQNQPNIEITMVGDDVIYPANMSAGQVLPDAEMEMSTAISGMTMMKNRFKIYNRKVEALETLTTSAGNFKCYRISYDMDYNALGKRTMHCVYWFSDNVGMVKTETYGKKGDLESRMELTKVTR